MHILPQGKQDKETVISLDRDPRGGVTRVQHLRLGMPALNNGPRIPYCFSVQV